MSTRYPNKTFPFSALICKKHRKILAKLIIQSHSTPIEDPDTANECNYDDNCVAEVLETMKILDDLSLVLENSPVKFQVTKPVEELQGSALRYLRKKVNAMQKQAVIKLLEHVAPGQGNLLKNILFPKKNATIDVLPEIEKLLFQAVVAMKNVSFYQLYQIHTVKEKSRSYSTVQGIFLIKQKSYLTFNR